MKYLIVIILIISSSLSNEIIKEKPKIAFSFDDGSVNSKLGIPAVDWNQMILDNLSDFDLKAALFVTAGFLEGKTGDTILNSWDQAGHKIGNHTYTHPYFHSPKITLNDYKNEFLRCDSVIQNFENYFKYFRFCYLKEGNTEEKRDGFREFLNENAYKNAHVSIDASDWYVDSRMIKKLDSINDPLTQKFKEYYVNHIFDRALYYDSLSTIITGRKINHVLLLHHNLTSALFLDDILNKFKKEGWDLIDIDKAYEDDFYNEKPDILPAGESLVWSLAKLSGEFESALRYPAESGKYEEAKMDSLGL